MARTFVAGENLYPGRFVKFGSAANTVVAATAATDAIVGVTGEAGNKAPLPGATNYAAATGDEVKVYQFPDETTDLEAGESITETQFFLTATTGGKAAAASAGNVIGAVRVGSGTVASGEKFRAQVMAPSALLHS